MIADDKMTNEYINAIKCTLLINKFKFNKTLYLLNSKLLLLNNHEIHQLKFY